MIKTKEMLIEEYSRLPEISELFERENPEWADRRRNLRKHVANDDVDEFLRWSTVSATMFTRESDWIDKEYLALLENNTNRWMMAITELSKGTPHRYSGNSRTSGNLIHQAYHLMQLEKFSEHPISWAKRIVEFGGGYGAMCAIARRLGFKGAYHIYDLPEMTLLQDYYLNQTGYGKNLHLHPIDDAGRFDVPPLFVDFLIACYSLNEVRGKTREVFIQATRAQYVLMATGVFWGEKGALKPIEKLMSKLDKYDWELNHSETQGGVHHYLLGERNVND